MCRKVEASCVNSLGDHNKRMGKKVMLSEEAYTLLASHRRANESFSDLVKRLVLPPIKTFGDLERHLENVEGPLFSDMTALRRLRSRKRRFNAGRLS
jgi:predicted CopG family antitoxin